jgi:L-lysine exporter family protein LysE/ArgO
MTLALPTFAAGMAMSLSLVMAIGPQNAHVLRMGLQRQHLALTALVCMLADAALIGLGVFGLAQLGGLSPKVHGALVGAGMVFLAVYGWQAAQRAWRGPGTTSALAPAPAPAAPTSRRQAVATALAFSWLNPHAWLDTAVLIGTASLAYGQAGPVFGLGAATGSVLWFVALGVAAFWLGQRLNSVRVWRALDAMVALMMWGTALVLMGSLL